ncbi:MAG TPA: cytochrome c-type biogenesis protein CcmH [Chloroflexota bacterium]|nr:cytochrome c-type biogenesis protein CcmH [Chloroflexota bacterium]
MRRRLGWIAIAWLVAICALALAVYGSAPVHAGLDERTTAVASQLRCLVCQGESVADSPSGFAAGIRALIRRDLRAGETPAQIESFLVSRYGNRILMAPQSGGIGQIAWLAPPLLVLGGLGFVLTLIFDWRNRGRTPVLVADSYLERVRAELAEE